MTILFFIGVVLYVLITLFIGGIRLGDYVVDKEFANADAYKDSARLFIRTPLWPLDLLKAFGQVFVDARKL